MTFVSVLLLVFVLVIMIASFAVYSFKSDQEEATMPKFRNMYLYLVSFVTLMMILVGIIFTVHSIADLMFPTNYTGDIYYEKDPNVTEEAKKAYAENQRIMQENQQVERQKSVVKSAAVVVVSLPAFLYHWRKIEREKPGPV